MFPEAVGELITMFLENISSFRAFSCIGLKLGKLFNSRVFCKSFAFGILEKSLLISKSWGEKIKRGRGVVLNCSDFL